MCGIVGYVGTRESIPILLEGLERLEYRGYDSSGVAVQHDGTMTVCKAKGKVSALQSLALPCDMPGPGIGHTRWATHGEPSDANAHPHVDQSGRIAVVHNGIIENASIIRERLKGQGVVFRPTPIRRCCPTSSRPPIPTIWPMRCARPWPSSREPMGSPCSTAGIPGAWWSHATAAPS